MTKEATIRVEVEGGNISNEDVLNAISKAEQAITTAIWDKLPNSRNVNYKVEIWVKAKTP